MVGGVLYRIGRDSILRWCLLPHEMTKVIVACHNSAYGGHFGTEVTVELEVPALRTAVEHAMDWDGAIQQRLNELERLDETRLLAFQAREALQKRRKKWHDDHIRERKFAIGDLVLLYGSKFWKRPGKLKIQWLGPYVVVNVNNNGSVQVANLSGNLLPTRINGF
ncbi:uncharacterized protein LOC112348836 [Selaginella moellendorffii]|uniref:uncharacterized protein LOC112348836 n=1 Tax=Selaginella moellendorffii TaxID=88036 RepID=UPI000D1C445E|nr:uncharacterized protein LOC112348836 [Selaginella moellendorffii]|eukprot:XP_024537838.1 uncharacterized protein LOC112348836 [Selaginella moellendorffii]